MLLYVLLRPPIAPWTHLSSGKFPGVLVQFVHVGRERLEIRDHEFPPEGLSQQDDVALYTPVRNRHDDIMNNPRLLPSGQSLRSQGAVVSMDIFSTCVNNNYGDRRSH